MTAAEELRDKLHAVSASELYKFIERTDLVAPSVEFADFNASPDHWKEQVIDLLVALRHTTPQEFSTLCEVWGVKTDAERSVDYQRVSAEAASRSASAAEQSAASAAAAERHAETANRTARAMRRYALWSGLVAFGMMLITLGALIHQMTR